jgi:hypothetical protein
MPTAKRTLAMMPYLHSAKLARRTRAGRCHSCRAGAHSLVFKDRLGCVAADAFELRRAPDRPKYLRDEGGGLLHRHITWGTSL